MKVDVPIQELDALENALELVHVGHAAQVLHKVEAHAAETLLVELFEVALGKGIISVRDTAVLPATLGNRIDNDSVINSVAARVHQHRTLEAKDGLQLLEARKRRIRGCVRAIERVRITVAWTKNMAVRVTCTGGRTILRLMGIRVGRFAGRNVHRTDFQGLAVSPPGVAAGFICYRNGPLPHAQCERAGRCDIRT